MRLLLAGGAGTLGTDIVENLYTEHDILVIDDFLEAAESEEWFIDKTKVIKCNLSAKEAFSEEVINWQPECIIYLATTVSADAGRGFASVEGIKNLIDLEYSSENLPRILYIQSFLTRDCSLPISPESQIEARDQYATWKLAGELVLSNYSGEHSNIVLASVISSRLTVGAIPAFARRIADGQIIKATLTNRDYLHPSDFISAVSALLKNPNIPEQLTIGSDASTPTLRIAVIVGQVLGETLAESSIHQIAPSNADPSHIVFNSHAFRSWSGWTPKHVIEDAIADCVNLISKRSNKIRTHHEVK